MSIDHVEVTGDTAHWMKSQGWSYVMSTQHEEELRYAIQDARDEYPQHALHVCGRRRESGGKPPV